MEARAIAVGRGRALDARIGGRALDGAATSPLDGVSGRADGAAAARLDDVSARADRAAAGRLAVTDRRSVVGRGTRVLDKVAGRALDVGLAGIAAAQLAAAAWLVPTASGGVATSDGTPLGALCWLHAAFGIDCPMCGMTRSFVALAHGDVGAALRFHPAGPLLFVAMVVLVVAVAITAARRTRPLVERRRFVLAFQAIALLCLAMGILKMVRS